MSYFVYVLLCHDGSYYTGIAIDVAKRFDVHVSGRGAKYTRSHRPIKIVYTEECSTKSLALIREHKLKTLSHQQKAELFGDM